MSFKKHLMGLVCVLIASTAIVESAYAKTFYVSAKGNDKGNGTAGAPFRTIGKAAKAGLKPGDVVLVKPGTYYEGIWLTDKVKGSAGNYITFRSETPRGAKLRPPKNYGFFLMGANYIKIDGFDISGSSQSGISVQGSHHVEITNNVSTNNKGAGIYSRLSDFLLVEGNVTNGNAANAVTSGISIHMPQEANGFSNFKGFRIVVRNNIAANNLTKTRGHTDGNGIIFDDFLLRNKRVHGLYKEFPGIKPYTHPALIENNLVYENGGAGITVYATDNVIVRNNTAWHNGQDPLNKGTWRGEFKNMSAGNNVWANNIGVSTLKIPNDKNNVGKYNSGFSYFEFKDTPNKNVTYVNNMSYTDGKPGDDSLNGKVPKGVGNKFGVNPKFISASSGNFRLNADSPAINAGTMKYGASDKALGGTARVVKAIDMGAYERPLNTSAKK